MAALSLGVARADPLSAYLPEGVPGYAVAPGVTVASRLRPDYEANGVRVGAAILHAGVEAAIGGDSDVTGEPNGPASLRLVTAPSVRITTDWSRDQIGAAASVRRVDLPNVPAQSYTDASISIGGRLDVGRDQLSLGFAYLSLHQTPDQLGGLLGVRPIPFQVADARLAYETNIGRLSLTPTLDVSTFRYDGALISNTAFGAGPTTRVSQSGRDRDVLQAGATLSYMLAERRSLLMISRWIASDQTNRPAGTASTSARAALVLLGADMELDGALRSRVLAGVEQRDFAAHQYGARAALVAEAAAIWTPTGLTTVIGALDRSIEDPSAEGTAGFVATAASLGVDHELRRDLLLHGGVSVERADYIPGNAGETVLDGRTGITWLLQRGLSATASLDLAWHDRGAGVPTVTSGTGAARTGAARTGTSGTGSTDRAIVSIALHVGL